MTVPTEVLLPINEFSLLHQVAESAKHIHSLKVEEVVVGLRLVLKDRLENGRHFPGFWGNLEKCLFPVLKVKKKNSTIFETFVFIKMRKKCLHYSG